MLSLILALLATPIFNDVVFDDGGTHQLTQADLSPTDNVIVLPLSSSNGASISVFGQAVIQSLTTGSACNAQLAGDTIVLGDVTSQSGGSTVVASAATIQGRLHVESFGTAFVALDGSVGSGGALVEVDGYFDLSGGMAGSLRNEGSCFVAGRIVGSVVTAGSGSLNADGCVLLGPVVVEGSADLMVRASRFENSVTLSGDSTATVSDVSIAPSIIRGQVILEDAAFARVPGTIGSASPIRVEDSATLVIVALTASVPFGVVSASSGVITGTTRPGVPFSLAFSKTAGATVIVEDAETTFGDFTCHQSEPNSTGIEARLYASGSRFANDRDLVLTATDVPPNAIGFFLVGTSHFPVQLRGSTICVGGNRGRYVGPGQIQNSGPNGIMSLAAPTDPVPGNPGSTVMTGDVLRFQACFRDSGAAGSPIRFSHGRRVVFL